MLRKTQKNTLVILRRRSDGHLYYTFCVHTNSPRQQKLSHGDINRNKQTNEKSECSSFLPDSLITDNCIISTELVVIATLWETVVMCTNTDYIIKSHAKNKIMEELQTLLKWKQWVGNCLCLEGETSAQVWHVLIYSPVGWTVMYAMYSR